MSMSYVEDRNACDFGDLLAHTVRVLRSDDRIRASFAGRFAHLLVDEFQDVNPAQVAFIEALLAEHRNIWAVGDDDQCLYAFRSADVKFILGFESLYQGAGVHRLSQNYRSTPPIIVPATRLIAHNRRRYDKPLHAVHPTGPKVVIIRHEDDEAEAEWIAASVAKLLAAGRRPRDVAVLFRAGHIGGKLQLPFTRRRIPIVLRGVRDFWAGPEARLVVAMLRLAANDNDQEAHHTLGEGNS